MGLEMEELLNMTEAHLSNVKQEVAKLSQQKVAIDQEIEKLTAYLERGQAVLDSHRAEAQQKASPVKDTPFSSIAGGP
jgi:regulator of replication initiation timing|tara:strand:- start:743 stop:976 length:234 start_codon:yes stop_codon:yes gene_type:complete